MAEENYTSELLAQIQNGYYTLRNICFALLAVILIIVGVFVWYIYNTDEYSVEATGIYTAVDRSGNLVSADVDPETWQMFMEWLELNGESEGNR